MKTKKIVFASNLYDLSLQVGNLLNLIDPSKFEGVEVVKINEYSVDDRYLVTIETKP